MMSLDLYLISDADLSFEQDVLRYPFQLNPWIKYIDYKSTSAVHERVFIFERACRDLGRSYKLWKMYLDFRVQCLAGVCPAKYADEYEKVNECFERALLMLAKMPRLWIMYLEFLKTQTHITATRRVFDQALRALPVSQHDRIWPLYLEFARAVQGPTAAAIYKRYVQYRPQDVEDYIDILVASDYYAQAAKEYVKILNNPDFRSKNGKSQYQIWTDLTDLLVHYARDIRDYHRRAATSAIKTEQIIRSGIAKFSDQRGKLWVNLAMYRIALGEYEWARDVFEEAITTVMTVRDFTLAFDAYAEFEESVISRLMAQPSTPETDAELDLLMLKFEQLMDRRPFLLNDVMLRQNPNNVFEWEKRVGLWGSNQHEIVATYTKAISTIDPKKTVPGQYYKLWTKFAKFYESAGAVDGDGNKDGGLRQARIIFDRGVKVPFKSATELADLYIEWAEMELRAENMDNAVAIIRQATTGPKKSSIDFFDESLPAQQRVFKSMKLWSFYVDLVESVGTIEETKAVYDRMFELKIATPLTVVNYANFLEEHQYFEDSFKIYERGISSFSFPVAFELWNIYLTKALSRKLSIERLRDLFEQAIANCPGNLAKPLYVLYGNLEETRGLARNAVEIYERATKTNAVSDADRLEMYKLLLARTAAIYGLPSTRPIYERAIDELPDAESRVICLEFAGMETKLGEIDRARGIYVHGSQFADPRVVPRYWERWHEFEVSNGDEQTYKEMLRIKRLVTAQYNTDMNFVSAAVAAPKAITATAATAALEVDQDKMAALDNDS
ncbi:uncharacterized protein V1516DRAFT_655256 [Lipomyces oligophaga]|uniref:uncharacterized protein n=1 Tax=Lipomyces oligophaga TaxID=45792 RepID=UPI0034CDA7B0